MRYSKFWTSVLVTVLAAVIPALTSEMTTASWVNVVLLAAGDLMVVNASNVPGWEYAKLVAAAVSAVAVVLTSALTDGGISGAEVIQMIVAGAGALGVGVIPNSNAEPKPAY